jgi:hypothetical protein
MAWERGVMKQYLLSIYQPDGPPPPAVSTATVVRVKDGEALLTDGPFAEGKEHIGGFTIVKAPDLDAALEWGRKLARATTLPIEVRPLREYSGG